LADLTPRNAEPFSARMWDLWSSQTSTTSREFEVPMGTRLVVEFVSITATVPTDQRVRGQLRIADWGHAVRLTRVGSFWYQDHWAASQLIRVYAEPGETVALYLTRFPPTWGGSWSATIVGYVVPP
jgi:hypothetical protein